MKTIEGVTTVNLGQVSSEALSQLGVKLTDRGNNLYLMGRSDLPAPLP